MDILWDIFRQFPTMRPQIRFEARRMAMAFYKKAKTQFLNIKNSAAVKKINQIIYSPWGVGILGLLTFLAFASSLEIVFYSIAIVYAIFVGLFADDLSPIMPLFLFCYVTPSLNNNPGLSNEGLFFGATAIYLICILSVGVTVLLLRIALDKDFGLRRLFTTKRALLWGMLALGAAYLLSGVGHSQYWENAAGNFLFAFIQFASIFLLYFIFSTTVKWEKFNLDYFAWVGLVVGLVVSAEVLFLYLSNSVMAGDGAVDRSMINTGWGCCNNVGAMISLSIPFAFYFTSQKKRSSIFLCIACLLVIAVVLSTSRGSLLGALYAFIACFIVAYAHAHNKKEFRITSIVLASLLVVFVIVFYESLATKFAHILTTVSVQEGEVVIRDSSRFVIYQNGWEIFLRNPIFGQSFYPLEFDMFSFAQTEQFQSFFPPRWHNTIIQMLASCGIVGMIAYGYHRFDTIRLYIKKRTLTNTYIFHFIITLLIMSLLDCHFFNVGPVFFYSMALAVMEFGKEDTQKKITN